jgi:dTDP-4-amino-4,6-dideoxygalactose transaminase
MDAGPTAAIPITRPHLPSLERFSEVIAELFETRMLSNFAKYSRLLESRAATLLDHPGPQCVSSCDIGMVLAWRALDGPSGEVIVPSFTFCSTVNSLRWCGLTPVFADVDPETYCLDPEDVRRRITPRTVGIAAVHTFGLPADIEALEGLAAEHDLRIVFDAAHGLGGRYRGRALGAFGDASVFSLSGTKLVTGGEGGLATFRDAETADRFNYLRAYGFRGDYNCRHIGLNGKLSEMNAALAWLSLDLIDEVMTRRLAQVARYRQALAECNEVAFQSVPDGCVHGYKDLAIRFADRERREAAEAALAAAGIMTKRYFFPAHRMESYRADHRYALAVTDRLAEQILCVPLFHDLKDAQIDGIAATIRGAIGRPPVRISPRPGSRIRHDDPAPHVPPGGHSAQPAGPASTRGNSGAGLPSASDAVTRRPA